MKARCRLLLDPSSFILLASLFLTACVTTEPRPVASSATYIKESQASQQQVVPMSDEEARHQRAGTTISRKTAGSETVIKQGRITKQTEQTITTRQIIPITNNGSELQTTETPASTQSSPSGTVVQTEIISNPNDPVITSPQILPISDNQPNQQTSGTTELHQPTSQPAAGNATLQKNLNTQPRSTDETVETDTSTVVETFSVPTADEDAR